jgi:hypothetical protein
MTLHADGRIIRSTAEVAPGDSIRTRLADGDFASTVQSDSPTHANLPTPPPQAARRAASRKPARSTPRDQMDLFGQAR